MQTTEPVAEPAQGVDAAKPQTLAQCREMIDTLVQLVAEHQREIAWLHERVTLNSRTSSKPPSSDGPGSATWAQRRARQRKRGVQKDHSGSYRALVAESRVGQVIDCLAPEVCECSASVMPAGEAVRHQVFEIRMSAGHCAAAAQSVVGARRQTGAAAPRAWP